MRKKGGEIACYKITSVSVRCLAISSADAEADLEENLEVCHCMGRGDWQRGQTGRRMGSAASWLEGLQLVTKGGAQVGFCCDSPHCWKQNSGRTSQRRAELVLETSIMISPTVLLDWAPKRPPTLNWGNRNLLPGFSKQVPRC